MKIFFAFIASFFFFFFSTSVNVDLLDSTRAPSSTEKMSCLEMAQEFNSEHSKKTLEGKSNLTKEARAGEEAFDGKYINVNPEDRFVDAEVLRNSYIKSSDPKRSELPPFVTIKKTLKNKTTGEIEEYEFELGIVDVNEPEIAKAVSSLLSRSLEDAKYTNGGYLPPSIVERVQTDLISPDGVKNRWGKAGHRFVISRKADNGNREIVGSILVSRDSDTIFFFTSKFNNVRLSKITEDVDFNAAVGGVAEHKWFDKFKLPKTEDYKPKDFHHIANFVVEKEGMRGLGLSRLIIDSIVENYTSVGKGALTHSQPMLKGKGFWQIGDPPWLDRMGALGFYPRLGAETFHVDVPWEKLVPTKDADGKIYDHVSYNKRFKMPQIYEDLLGKKDSSYRKIYDEAVYAKEHHLPPPVGDPLIERIPEVIALAKSGKAKIQYFQLLYPFVQKP